MHWLPPSTMEDIVLFHNIPWDPQRSIFPAFPYPSIFMLVVRLLLFSRSVVSDSLRPHGFPVPHHLPEFAQVHVHWISDAIQLSYPLLPSSPAAFNLSQHQGLPVSQLFVSGGQIIGASASVSVLPMSIQGWFPLGLTGLILLSNRL